MRKTRGVGSRRCVGTVAEIDAFGEVQRGCEVAKLRQRQGDFLNLIRAGVELFDGHAILKSRDRDVFLTMG